MGINFGKFGEVWSTFDGEIYEKLSDGANISLSDVGERGKTLTKFYILVRRG